MRTFNVLSLLCLTAAPTLGLAQQRDPGAGDDAPVLAPGAEAPAEAPGAEAPSEPAGGGMTLTVEGVTDEADSLRVRGADALKAGNGSLGLLGGRLIIGREGARVHRMRGAISGGGGARFEAPAGSNLQITGGSIYLQDQSRLSLSDSSFAVSGGNLNFSGGSNFNIGGGDVVFTGDSVLNIDTGSKLQVSGGNITFHDDAVLTASDSTLSINGGNFRIYDFVDLNFDSVQIAVRGGDLSLQGQASLTVNGGSLTVRDGALYVAERSTVHVNGGDLVLRNASVETNFAVLLTGAARGDCGNSDLRLGDGGSLRINETATFEGRRSTFTVPDGSLSFGDLAALDAACAGDVVVAVKQGRTTAVCLRPTASGGPDDRCLSYLDERSNRWVCEDTCLKSKGGHGQICGTTDHL